MQRNNHFGGDLKVVNPSFTRWFIERQRTLPFLAAIVFLLGVCPANADTSATNSTDLSLEQLINIQVTSVSKKETTVESSPAAITVISADDIDRLGFTTLPDALRLVPGIDVAQISANQWAINVRGFNAEVADKLLVLIDGRSVYTPARGVFWNEETVMMADLDRIEVVRGPGAALWGANAVNGVINIVTKSADQTQGLLLSAAGGSEIQPLVGVRYGGLLASNLYYRVYLQRSDYAELRETTGKGAGDSWDTTEGGFRLDWKPPTQNTVTFQGNYYYDDTGAPSTRVGLAPPITTYPSIKEYNSGGNLLGRWTHDFSASSQLTLQAYYDHTEQNTTYNELFQNTYDIDLQEHFAVGSWNDFVVGAGYRNASIGAYPTFAVTYNPPTSEFVILNTFAQDDMTIIPDRLHLTLGSKLEYDSIASWEPQPDARLLWTPTDKQTVWASVSMATATPALIYPDARINVEALPTGPSSPPALVSVLPNSDIGVERLMSYQLGYRHQLTPRLSLDATAFYNVYDDLIVAVPTPPRIEFNPGPPHLLIADTWENAGAANTYGAELSGTWRVTDTWRLMASYSWLHMHLNDPAAQIGTSPPQQFQVRSYLDLPYHLQLNGNLSFVDRCYAPNASGIGEIPAYARFDLGLVWHPTRALEIGVWGENLLQSEHVEFSSQQSPELIGIPRSIMAKITWRF